MPNPSKDPQNNVPDSCPVALLLIDVINDLEFEDSEKLARYALPMAARVAALKRRAKAAGIPAIYVNDNFGRWQSDFRRLVRSCLEQEVRGRPMVQQLQPEPDDYFVLKPKNSGFYLTPLEMLLAYLGAQTLILTGMAGNICVYLTAADANMRHFSLVVPEDCVASNTAEENNFALEQMRNVMHADTRPSAELDLQALLCPPDDDKQNSPPV